MSSISNNRFRKDFPLIKNRNISYLDNSATTQKPTMVINRLKQFYEKHNANVHRGLYKLSEEATTKLHEARIIIASFINASPDEVIFTKNSTESLNNLANSIGRTLVLDDKHNIVTTIIEHHSNFVPWQQLAKRTDAQFRIVDYDIKTNRLGNIQDMVDENTLILAITGMSNVTGLIPNLKNIIIEVRKKNKNVIVVVDATQLVAHERIDVKELDADFLVFSGHKVYGPTGVGILYGKIELLEKINPFNYGGNMVNIVDLYDSDWAEIPDKFEAGTIDTPGIVSTAEAIKYLEKNFEDIIYAEKILLKYLLGELRKIKEVKIIGHNDKNSRYGPIVSFAIEGIHPHDLATICDEYDVCIRAGHHCAQPFMKKLGVLATSRASIGAYNTKEDVDRLIKAIKHAIKIITKDIKSKQTKHKFTKVI